MNNNQKAPTLHYAYTHICLRDLVFNNTNFFIQVFNAGPSNMKHFLHDYWMDIKEKNPGLTDNDIELLDSDFNLSLTTLDNEQKLLLIKLPEPNNPPEAFFVGIVISELPRYFTLELGQSISTNQVVYVVCEWNKDRNHSNYGAIPEMRSDFFCGRINNIIGDNNQKYS